MKQFGIILGFEFKYYLKNKIFVGVTLLMVILIVAAMFWPRVWELLRDDEQIVPSERPSMLISTGSVYDVDDSASVFAEAFPAYEVQITSSTAEEIKELVLSGTVQCAFVLDGYDKYTYYVRDLGMYDTNTAAADAAILKLYRLDAMHRNGIEYEEAEKILSKQVDHTVERLGKDQMSNFFYTYIMIFALYMVIMIYGQLVVTNVAVEKSSRAMELLITSASPVSMMFGKVIAACIAGFLQMFCVFGASMLSYRLNTDYWSGNIFVGSIFGMPVWLLGYMLMFFVLGFFLYAFLYGAVGSTATKLEDINTTSMPLTMFFVFALVAVIASLASGNVDGGLMKTLSFIPFTSPMAMFARIAMTSVPVYEVVISVAILAMSVVAAGVTAAKIYRVGVLMYGTQPTLGAVFKAMRNA